MKSGYPDPEEVVEGLGDKVVDSFSLMVAQTREDLRVYRTTFPGWVADSTDRGLLNWCHDRLWVHCVRLLGDLEHVTLVDRPPLREIGVGVHYRLRVKKHDVEGKVSTYLTQGALEFLEQESSAFEGMEQVRLIAGYRWLPEERQLGAAVISLRDGKDDLVWMHDLDEPPSASVMTTVPIVPSGGPRRPEISLRSDEGVADDGTQEDR
jgi:hypothetical protein